MSWCRRLRLSWGTTISRFAGIDYGSRRIGLAISDPTGSIASPLTTVNVAGDAGAVIAQITRAVEAYDVDEWVVGLPLNMDGTDSRQTVLTRRFAEALGRRVGQPVHLWDERLSSHEAEAHLVAADLTLKQRKVRRDRLAAQIMLQSFLDARRDKPPDIDVRPLT